MSNAGSYYFEDRCDLTRLNEINWEAVLAKQWGGDSNPILKEGKQAEFLLEHSFPWCLVDRIGVKSSATYQQVALELSKATTKYPQSIEIIPEWYY